MRLSGLAPRLTRREVVVVAALASAANRVDPWVARFLTSRGLRPMHVCTTVRSRDPWEDEAIDPGRIRLRS